MRWICRSVERVICIREWANSFSTLVSCFSVSRPVSSTASQRQDNQLVIMDGCFQGNLKEVRVEAGCTPRGCLLLYDILKPNQSSLSSRSHKVLCAWGPMAVISLIKVRDRVWCLFRSLLVKPLNQPWKGSRTTSGQNTFCFVFCFCFVCFAI